jgi:DNA-binding LytR/AlgR family response regulator
MDNYSAVYFIKEGKADKVLLRGSLKFMESQLTSCPNIIRCHRTYIVNLSNVTSASGNAQGYKLSVANSTEIITVSRSYLSTVLQQFEKLK